MMDCMEISHLIDCTYQIEIEKQSDSGTSTDMCEDIYEASAKCNEHLSIDDREGNVSNS